MCHSTRHLPLLKIWDHWGPISLSLLGRGKPIGVPLRGRGLLIGMRGRGPFMTRNFVHPSLIRGQSLLGGLSTERCPIFVNTWHIPSNPSKAFSLIMPFFVTNSTDYNIFRIGLSWILLCSIVVLRPLVVVLGLLGLKTAQLCLDGINFSINLVRTSFFFCNLIHS